MSEQFLHLKNWAFLPFVEWLMAAAAVVLPQEPAQISDQMKLAWFAVATVALEYSVKEALDLQLVGMKFLVHFVQLEAPSAAMNAG